MWVSRNSWNLEVFKKILDMGEYVMNSHCYGRLERKIKH